MNLNFAYFKEDHTRIKSLFVSNYQIDLDSVIIEKDEKSIDITFDIYHNPIDRVKFKSNKLAFISLSKLTKLPFKEIIFIDNYHVDSHTMLKIEKDFLMILVLAYIYDISLEFLCSNYIVFYLGKTFDRKPSNLKFFYNEDEVKYLSTILFIEKGKKDSTLEKDFNDERYPRYALENIIKDEKLIITPL